MCIRWLTCNGHVSTYCVTINYLTNVTRRDEYSSYTMPLLAWLYIYNRIKDTSQNVLFGYEQVRCK